jgi:competence protein ComEC
MEPAMPPPHIQRAFPAFPAFFAFALCHAAAFLVAPDAPLIPPLVAICAGLTLALAAAPRLRALALPACVVLAAIFSAALRQRPAPIPSEPVPVRVHGTVSSVTPDEGFTLLHPAPLTPLDLPLPRELRVSAPPFDLPAVGTSIEVDAELRYPRVPLNPQTTPRSRPNPFADALTDPTPSLLPPSLRASAHLALRDALTFPSDVATALLRALLLGDRTELSPAARFAFQDTGTAHLLAISGMNLALVGLGLYALLMRLLMLPPLRTLAHSHRVSPIAASLALATVTAYALVIAPSDATDRALAALAVGLSAVILARRQDALHTLLLALAGAALIDPEAFLRAGFQLSFTATAAIILVLPLVTRWRTLVMGPPPDLFAPPPSRLVRLRRTLLLAAGALAMTDLATFLATVPLSLAWFGQLPVHGLWVNLVAIPMMGLLFPVALLWLVLALLVPSLADLLAPMLSDFAVAFHDLVTALGQAVGPSTTAAWPLSLGVLGSLAMLALVHGIAKAQRRSLRASALALGLTAASFTIHNIHPGDLELTVLDVGHGDALALRLPGGARMLVDAGGAILAEQNRRIGERIVVPSLLALGFDRLDLMVITHADLDHVGAAAIVAARIPVGTLWLGPCARGAPAIEALIATVIASGGTVRTLAAGPPLSYSGATLELLGPALDLERGLDEQGFALCRAKENDASLVLRVAYAGRRLLFTGDIETPAEAELLELQPDLRADVLKVPHHGSRTSSTDALLDAVRPRVALVSGLPGRAPMPPHDAVLARYAERGIPLLMTGRDGALRVSVTAEGELVARPLIGDSPPLRLP